MSSYINSIILATIVYVFIGYVWYSDFLFGLVWKRISGLKMNVQAQKKAMVHGVILSFFTAWILASLLVSMPEGTIEAVRVVFWGWLIFLVPYALQSVIYSNKSFLLVCIDALYNLVAYVTMAAIIIHFNSVAVFL
jgi:hypothetical protein